MGRLLIRTPAASTRLPLSASTRLGRHWSSDGRIDLPDVPLHWLEVRWYPGGWRWRCLGGESSTRGPGVDLGEGWRGFVGRRPSVHLGDLVVVELVDPAAPELVVEDLYTRQRYEWPDLAAFLSVTESGAVVPRGGADGALAEIDGEPASGSRALRDGDVFVVDGRPYQVHLPVAFPATRHGVVDLGHPELVVDLQLDPPKATFSLGQTEIVVAGEAARVVVVYGEARLRGTSAGGWLDARSAHAGWVALGGREDSPVDRLAWERHKARTRLEAMGAIGTDRLFELDRRGPATLIRLGIAPAQLVLSPGA